MVSLFYGRKIARNLLQLVVKTVGATRESKNRDKKTDYVIRLDFVYIVSKIL